MVCAGPGAVTNLNLKHVPVPAPGSAASGPAGVDGAIGLVGTPTLPDTQATRVPPAGRAVVPLDRTCSARSRMLAP